MCVMWVCWWRLTVCQRLEPPRHSPVGRLVGHEGLNAGLVLIERILERSGQVTRLSGRQLQTTGHRPPRALPPEWPKTDGGRERWESCVTLTTAHKCLTYYPRFTAEEEHNSLGRVSHPHTKNSHLFDSVTLKGKCWLRGSETKMKHKTRCDVRG